MHYPECTSATLCVRNLRDIDVRYLRRSWSSGQCLTQLPKIFGPSPRSYLDLAAVQVPCPPRKLELLGAPQDEVPEADPLYPARNDEATT